MTANVRNQRMGRGKENCQLLIVNCQLLIGNVTRSPVHISGETAVSTPKNPTNAVDGILPIHSPSAASRRFSHHHAAPLE